MATCAATYLDSGRSWEARVAEQNAELMAQQPLHRRGARTPEVFFPHNFDNSRLKKASDPARLHQMRVFSATLTVLFLLVMVYGVQHFWAIETGYRVESEKKVVEHLREKNRQLKLAEAQLTDPQRIARLAREMGLAKPQPDQMIQPSVNPNAGPSVMAQVTVPALPPQ